MALLETCGKISTFSMPALLFYVILGNIAREDSPFCYAIPDHILRSWNLCIRHELCHENLIAIYTPRVIEMRFRWCSLSPDLVRWVGQAWTSRACNRCSGNLFRESYPDLLDGRRSGSGRVWLPFLDRFKKTRLGRFPFLKFSTTRAFWILTWLHDRADQ